MSGVEIPAGMVPFGPEHPDYPNAPKDWDDGPVLLADGFTSRTHRSLLFWSQWGVSVLAYTPRTPAQSTEQFAKNAKNPAQPEAQRADVEHGLGPHATVIADDPDGFTDVAILVGGCVYLRQGDAQITMSRSVATQVAAALASPPAEPTIGAEDSLHWLADRDNLILFNGWQADGSWEVRRGSVTGEIRGRGLTPTDALRAAAAFAALAADTRNAKGEGE